MCKDCSPAHRIGRAAVFAGPGSPAGSAGRGSRRPIRAYLVAGPVSGPDSQAVGLRGGEGGESRQKISATDGNADGRPPPPWE